MTQRSRTRAQLREAPFTNRTFVLMLEILKKRKTENFKKHIRVLSFSQLFSVADKSHQDISDRKTAFIIIIKLAASETRLAYGAVCLVKLTGCV